VVIKTRLHWLCPQQQLLHVAIMSLRSPLATFEAEIPTYCIHVCDVNLRVNELCIHFVCSRFKLRLNPGILRDRQDTRAILTGFNSSELIFRSPFLEGSLSATFSSSPDFSLGNDFRNFAYFTHEVMRLPRLTLDTLPLELISLFERIKYVHSVH